MSGVSDVLSQREPLSLEAQARDKVRSCTISEGELREKLKNVVAKAFEVLSQGRLTDEELSKIVDDLVRRSFTFLPVTYEVPQIPGIPIFIFIDDQYQFRFIAFTPQEVIAKGSFKELCNGIDLFNWDKKLAVLKLKTPILEPSSVQDEIRLMKVIKKAGKENILPPIKYLAFSSKDEGPFMIQVLGKDLHAWLNINIVNMQMDHKLIAALQISKLLADLHEIGIVHRDIKTTNFIFIDEQIKLIDFGAATLVRNHNATSLPQTFFMPPEAADTIYKLFLLNQKLKNKTISLENYLKEKSKLQRRWIELTKGSYDVWHCAAVFKKIFKSYFSQEFRDFFHKVFISGIRKDCIHQDSAFQISQLLKENSEIRNFFLSYQPKNEFERLILDMLNLDHNQRISAQEI